MKELYKLLVFVFLAGFVSIKNVSAQDVLMNTSTVARCSDIFYDSGGSGGNYSDDEDYT